MADRALGLAMAAVSGAQPAPPSPPPEARQIDSHAVQDDLLDAYGEADGYIYEARSLHSYIFLSVVC
jgi:hypothetical protein